MIDREFVEAELRQRHAARLNSDGAFPAVSNIVQCPKLRRISAVIWTSQAIPIYWHTGDSDTTQASVEIGSKLDRMMEMPNK
jgi:hypothetical protein